tara:strand:+ start:210 stop:377 length:168 start_codon:yes stop_codon:yes gene_type:complete
MTKTIEWQVSITGMEMGDKTKYQVTGGIIGLFSMDKSFYSKTEAFKQFNEWLKRC